MISNTKLNVPQISKLCTPFLFVCSECQLGPNSGTALASALKSLTCLNTVNLRLFLKICHFLGDLLYIFRVDRMWWASMKCRKNTKLESVDSSHKPQIHKYLFSSVLRLTDICPDTSLIKLICCLLTHLFLLSFILPPFKFPVLSPFRS